MADSSGGFKKIIRFYFRNSSVPGISWIVAKNLSFVERLFWILFNITMLGCTTFLIHHMTEENLKTPIIVTPESSNLPIQGIDFPGVAICNINKISRSRAIKLAKLLKKIDKRSTLSDLLEDIKLLGNLYDYNMDDNGRQSNFQDILDDLDNTTDIDDPEERMRTLITPCEDMLKDCMWAGEKRNCSDLFEPGMTYEGICCVFNYVKSSPETFKQNADFDLPPLKPVRPRGSGIRNGLKVELINNFDDYFFTSLETTGYTVQIFSLQEYPDKISGSLSQIIVNAGKEVLLSIDVEMVISSDIIKVLPYDLRSCIFDDEERTVFGSYSHSDCLLECKLRVMNTLCSCIPITFSSASITEQYDEPSYCSLIDIPCLNKHRTKWLKYFPTGVSTTTLNSEKYDSMKCAKCLPTCNNVIYKVSSNTAPLLHRGDNHSHLNVFFNKAFGNSFKMHLSQTWYDFISNIGGVLSLCMGISVITLMELLIVIYKLVRYGIHRVNEEYFQ